MKTAEEIKRQLNHLRDYEGMHYDAIRTLKIIEDKLALMEVEIKKQTIADHEAWQWHKYPEEQPKEDGYYLIKTQHGYAIYEWYTYEDGLPNWLVPNWLASDQDIIAFCELPKYPQGGGTE